MKKYLQILVIILIFSSKDNIVNGQEIKSQNFVNNENLKEMEFPINTSFTLRFTKVDDRNFSFKIYRIEPYNKKLKMWNNGNIFKDSGEIETVEFFFTKTIDNSNILVMKSRSKYSIRFKSEIQTEENGEFIEIQNVGTHKGSITTEIWQKETYKIRLSNFELIN
jgi:hypothetical protein